MIDFDILIKQKGGNTNKTNKWPRSLKIFKMLDQNKTKKMNFSLGNILSLLLNSVNKNSDQNTKKEK
ncbi:hypothetical protein ET33_21980 [Paenibacillus tyrfis]|uniref:Uncharacterized protein n=1 Tax=Paenibacillus tyrfis TaxID=1501230 RepID=A0A081NVV9_9BACL|nr:hypothetical protein ET33_21980 [Paenibacillus tyrfis]